MIMRLLHDIADKIISVVEKFSNTKYWLGKSVAIITIITLIYAFPNYKGALSRDAQTETFDTVSRKMIPNISEMVARQIKDPMMVIPSYGGAQPEKRQFRLTMPVIGHVFCLSVNGLILLQQLIGILLFTLLILLTIRITTDRTMGILVALGFAFTYLGEACFIDLWPWFDGVAYCLLTAAMLVKKPFLIWFFIVAAAFVDERALIASPLIFLWWKLILYDTNNLNFKQLIKPDKYALSIVIAWITYSAIRYFLMKYHGFQTYSGGITGPDSAIKQTWKYFSFALLTGVKWFWLFILAGLLQLFVKKNYITLLLLIFISCIIILVSASVFDVTKSVTYIFPVVFICLFIIFKDGENVRNLRYITLLIVLLCFIMPSFNISGNLKYMLRPVFFESLNK